jgi:hypothetical protein
VYLRLWKDANSCNSVIALSKLYDLKDPRVAQIMVKGDLIVPQSDRIMTRSRARNSKHFLLTSSSVPLTPSGSDCVCASANVDA